MCNSKVEMSALSEEQKLAMLTCLKTTPRGCVPVADAGRAG